MSRHAGYGLALWAHFCHFQRRPVVLPRNAPFGFGGSLVYEKIGYETARRNLRLMLVFCSQSGLGQRGVANFSGVLGGVRRLDVAGADAADAAAWRYDAIQHFLIALIWNGDPFVAMAA
jgi:hypothetical protein